MGEKLAKLSSSAANDAMHIPEVKGKTRAYLLARAEVDPTARHAVVSKAASAEFFSALDQKAGVGDHIEALQDICTATGKGDLALVSGTLTAQALTLDALFTQLARRAENNLGSHIQAADTYLRLAMKAQAQSRATLEVLMKLHQPREQTVRHVHVGPDGQAVFIENLHGGMGNARIDGQAHEQRARGPALLGQDAAGNGLPVAGTSRAEAMPAPRVRTRQRRA